MRDHAIAVLPGDGAGPEIMSAAWEVLESAALADGGFTLSPTSYPWGCDHAALTGELMPADAAAQLRKHDAIYLTALGNEAASHRIAWEFYFALRDDLGQHICVRPIRSYDGVPTRVTAPAPIDMVIVRENSGGEYSDPGNVAHPHEDSAVATHTTVFTRHAVERVARYAFELAQSRRNNVISVTKSNVHTRSWGFWDRVVAEVAQEYPRVEYRKMFIDQAQMWMVERPAEFDVLVTSNLFGDILSDLGGAVVGGIGLIGSVFLNESRRSPSLFQAAHGSAPDIAGKGVANPVATILAGAMMLDFLGEERAAAAIRRAVEDTLRSGTRTRDIGGESTTADVRDGVIARIGGSPTAAGGAAVRSVR